MSARAKISLLAALLCLCTAPCSATGAVYGWGAESCGAWTEHRLHEQAFSADALQWVLGYVSANNVHANIDIAKGTDAEGMAAWIDDYCSKHPLDQLALATQSMLSEMVDVRFQETFRRLKTQPTSGPH